MPEEKNSNTGETRDNPSAEMADNKKAEDLIAALGKTRKNLRMYPANHPMYEKTFDDFCLKMNSFLEGGTLKIRINQYDILSNNEVIYHSRDKDESLALFFFKDGLRELTFQKGITREEIKDFLIILALDFEKEVLDDDIVTLLWERDFKNIKYIVDNAFLSVNDGYEQEATAQVKSAEGRSAEIMKAYEDARRLERASTVEALPLTNDDIQSILEEIESDPPDRTDILIHMLFEMFSMAQNMDEYEAITRCIKQTLEYAVTHARIKIVCYVIVNAAGGAQRAIYPEQAAPSLNNIEDHINSAAFVKLFGTLIDKGIDISGEDIQEFSPHLTSASIPHYISLLGMMKNVRARRIVMNILTHIGSKDMSLLARALHDKRWYVVRNIIYVLRQIGDEASAEFIIPATENPDKRVRKEAVYALGEFGTERALPVLEERMSDEAEAVRLAACIAAGNIGTLDSKKMIMEHIGIKGFRDKSFSEKKEVFKILSRWKEKDVIDFLIKVAQKRVFFKRKKNNETRAAALHSLRHMEDDKVQGHSGEVQKVRE